MRTEPIARAEGRLLFGADPTAYVAARPGYPEPVFELLRERCGVVPSTPTLEIGPGPGLLTARLLELGASPLVAVEPNVDLARHLDERFGARLQIVTAAFEDAQLAENAFEVAVAASSFHWVDQRRGLAEVQRVLRPGGWFMLVSNHYGAGGAPDAFAIAIDALMRPLRRAPSRSFALDVDARLGDLARSGLVAVEHEQVRSTTRFPSARIRDLFATFSPVITLPAPERERLLDAIFDIAERDFGGVVERAMVTAIYTARRAA